MGSKLGLITVLYHSDEVLEGFFRSISEQILNLDLQIYLIDNSPSASTETGLNRLYKMFPAVKCKHIRNHTNIGVAAANNIGIREATNDGYSDFIILNNDIEFDDRFLFSRIKEVADINGKHIIIPKIYYYGTNKLWFAGGSFNSWQCKVIHYGEQKSDKGQFNKAGVIEYAPTCFVYVSGEVVKKIGGMDEAYFVYVDDTDFMYRARRAAFDLWYEPSINIKHKVSFSTGGRLSDFSFFYNTRNRIYFSRKFFLFPKRQVAVAYIFISLLYFSLKEKRVSATRNVVKGFIEGLQMQISTKTNSIEL